MSKQRSGKAKTTVLGAAAVLVVLGAGIARATIPDSVGTIHGCYKKATGDLSVIDPGAGATCKPSEASLDWGQKGVDGSTGPQGVQGQSGPQGAQGPDGVADYQIVTAQATTAIDGPPPATAFFSASCPAGTITTGGGYQIPASANATPVNSSSDGTSWLVEVTGDAGVTVTAYAVCVDKQQLLGVN